MKATTENVLLTKQDTGNGSWIVKGFCIDTQEYRSMLTNDSMLIDDAFNCDEGETNYFDSVEEAKQALIDEIFNIL